MRNVLRNTRALFTNSKIRIAGIGLCSMLALASCQDDEDEALYDQVTTSASTSVQYDYLVPAGTASINGDSENADKNDFVVDAKPGTVIALEAGDYPDLNLKNLHGSSGNPVTIINYGGKVNIGTNAYSTVVKVIDCTNFRFTGSGSGDSYGISIDGSNAKTGEHTMEVYGVSSDFEIDHIEAFRSTFAGLVIKSDPKSFNPEVWRENFEMKNISVHDNYFHDTGGEGIYIGYTGDGVAVEGGGTAMPHLISGLRVYNNKVENSQWDGIQINRAHSDVEVYNNSISNYGLEKNSNQNTGLDIGYETVGRFYNNKVDGGDGIGIQVKGIGDVFLYNNVVLNAGYDGIYANDYNAENGRPGYKIVNNTVVNSGHFGIRLVNFKSTYGDDNTRDWVVNNVVAKVVGEGLGDRDFIHLANDETKAMLYNNNNLTYQSVDEASFTNGYELSDGAEGVDGGMDVASLGIRSDFNGNARPQGNGYDVGAYESGHSGNPTDPDDGTTPDPDNGVIGNPDITQTQLTANECGRMDGSMEDMLWADEVEGATSYEFLVSNTDEGYSQSKVTTARFVKLKDFQGTKANVVYTIVVRAIIGEDRGVYGNTCEFQVGGDAENDPENDPNLDTSLPITQLSADECGRLDGKMEDMLWADKVKDVDSYEFTIINPDTEEEESVISESAFVKLKDFKTAQTNVTYEIKIRTVKGEKHSAYGDSCEFQANK
ncbi:right-handed parallel beta-helix repeat-containing protein [Sediminitomix flava]|uniref:Parallel beta helix pectate lyase-like protein n=1 Tax=Sediminitomix flava TaxID=379075 RepID=A0A315ZEJ2_SEDFL|nr:right-handed parallel beta-helix repeat-containing protein [Sediminitomix flava]PWJ44026.1 parallel beta helix pectate lyase-like protein [Sediminitomix flava]